MSVIAADNFTDSSGLGPANFPNGVTSSSFLAPTRQIFTSGGGVYNLPTSPRRPVYIEVQLVGGGGGGSGGNNGVTPGAAGGDTTFGTMTAGHGFGALGATSGNGGSASLGVGPNGIAIPGSQGDPGDFNTGAMSGSGGTSALGGAGAGQQQGSATNGGNASANSGSGGGGGGISNAGTGPGGGGGGSGGYVSAIIVSPASTYSYSVGGGGNGGPAGGSGGAGGNGGSGVIIVTEFYQ